MSLQVEVLGRNKHSIELLFLVSISILLDNDLHRQVLDQFETEGFESVGLRSLTGE